MDILNKTESQKFQQSEMEKGTKSQIYKEKSLIITSDETDQREVDQDRIIRWKNQRKKTMFI